MVLILGWKWLPPILPRLLSEVVEQLLFPKSLLVSKLFSLVTEAEVVEYVEDDDVSGETKNCASVLAAISGLKEGGEEKEELACSSCSFVLVK